MKTLRRAAMLAAVAVAAVTTAAAADVRVVSSTPYAFAPPANAQKTITFDETLTDGTPGQPAYALFGNGKIVSGTLGDTYAAPGVEGGFDVTRYLAAFPAGLGQTAATLAEFGAYTAASLYWGSIDDYNALDFYSGGTLLGTITGSDASVMPWGDRTAATTNRRVSFASDTPFDRLVFRTGQNAFEVDSLSFSGAVAAVPEPASWGLMILGFGAVGWSMRRQPRRSRASATAAA